MVVPSVGHDLGHEDEHLRDDRDDDQHGGLHDVAQRGLVTRGNSNIIQVQGSSRGYNMYMIRVHYFHQLKIVALINCSFFHVS